VTMFDTGNWFTLTSATGSSVTIPSATFWDAGILATLAAERPPAERKPKMPQFVVERELADGRRERTSLTISVDIGNAVAALSAAECEQLARLACTLLGLVFVGAA